MGFVRGPVIGRHVDDLGVAVLVDVPQPIRDHVLVKAIEFGDLFQVEALHLEDIEDRVRRAGARVGEVDERVHPAIAGFEKPQKRDETLVAPISRG
jgi:hypothetical protein